MSGLAAVRSNVDGLDLSASDLRKISALMKTRTGITLGENAAQIVVARLSRHLHRLGMDTFRAYLAHVTGPGGASDLTAMVDALTTNTTHFFREPHHFEILETQLMPRLIHVARAGGRVRLWSAACATGKEPYSIAATVLKTFPDAGRHDVKILATDISSTALAIAESGSYDPASARAMPATTRRAIFEDSAEGEQVVVRPALRQLVSFRYLNFVEPWPLSGPFDAIFCRNVAIYMDGATQGRLWSGLERVLAEDGLLFIGHSERIGPDLAHRLEPFAPTSFRRPARVHTGRKSE